MVVTNQSGVARGLFTEKDLLGMNEYLIRSTGVDAVYYCPHHPEGKIAEYRKKCPCRKPETGLLEAAARDFEIDMERSFMVGGQGRGHPGGPESGSQDRSAGIRIRNGRSGRGGHAGLYTGRLEECHRNIVIRRRMRKWFHW